MPRITRNKDQAFCDDSQVEQMEKDGWKVEGKEYGKPAKSDGKSESK